MPRTGPTRVPVAGRERGTAAFATKTGTRPRAGGSAGAAPRQEPPLLPREFQPKSILSSPRPTDHPSPVPRPGALADASHVSQATPARRGRHPCRGPRERPAPPPGCCSGCGNRQGFASDRGAPCPAPHSSAHTGAMAERRHGRGLSVPPQPGGQRPASLGPLTCCWIFPSSVTTQWVVAAAGRVPEASSEHRPRAQPEKTHTRPSPPRPDAPVAAIFPNPGLFAAPGSGTVAGAILGAGGAARSGRCGRTGGRGRGGAGPGRCPRRRRECRPERAQSRGSPGLRGGTAAGARPWSTVTTPCPALGAGSGQRRLPRTPGSRR